MGHSQKARERTSIEQKRNITRKLGSIYFSFPKLDSTTTELSLTVQTALEFKLSGKFRNVPETEKKIFVTYILIEGVIVKFCQDNPEKKRRKCERIKCSRYKEIIRGKVRRGWTPRRQRTCRRLVDASPVIRAGTTRRGVIWFWCLPGWVAAVVQPTRDGRG